MWKAHPAVPSSKPLSYGAWGAGGVVVLAEEGARMNAEE